MWKWKHTNIIVHPQFGRLNLSRINEEVAKVLLLKGCPYLELTQKGRSKPLFLAKEVVSLIENAPNLDEAVRYSQLSDAESVKKALQKRAKELS